MRRALSIAFVLLAALWSAAPAGAAFGLKDLDVTFTDKDGATASYAGEHPFEFTTHLATVTRPEPALPEIGEVTEEEVKDLIISTPPGVAPNLTAVPRCSNLDFLTFGQPACSRSTRIGTAKSTINDPKTVSEDAVYNLVPPPGGVLKLGFAASAVRVTVEVAVKSTPPYNGIAMLTNIPNLVQFYSSEVTLWGTPAAAAHDEERGGPANVPEVPLFTSPRACEGPLETHFEAFSWQGSIFEKGIFTHNNSEPLGFIECGRLGFTPSATAKPSTDQAESSTGLDFELDVKDEGFFNPTGTADSDIKKTTVTLPEGVTLNPSIAEGLATCTPAQYANESVHSQPGEGCPEASKVGTVEVETPVLGDQILKGSLFVAQQEENPFHSLIALYMVIKDPELGLLFKLAGRVSPNPTTGQIETTFGEPGQELPQYPLSHVRIHLREGGRSPLISPPGCGTYITETTFTPWADPANPLTSPSSFQITKGVGGGPCPPAGLPPFTPGFSSGTLNNDAKAFSPFYSRLTRRDGDQDMTKLSIALPPGLSGILAGVSRCSDAAIATARGMSGRSELVAPSCPDNSRIGRVSGGAGVGSELTYVPGKLYLAGPYNGAPFSVVAIVPAVAGPFDVGNVVTRFALRINSRTLAAEVDGSRSDPLPHILAGIPLRVKDIRAYTDRPNFTFNPTNCDPLAVGAQIWGGGSNVFSILDDSPVSRSARFQAANCARLGFKPRFQISLKGGTKRGDHPALRSVVTPRPNDANFAQAVVTLPRSAFLDQGHIRTICTRVQFAAHACPAASIYGSAKATTPVLEELVEGPVYLRSSNHKLPDLVVALKGPPSAPAEAEVVGRLDSHKGGIRATFEGLPDFPVSKFFLEMQGGRKGLIVNSRNLCGSPSKAIAKFTGQNGKVADSRPVVKPVGCGAGKSRR